jgi:hemerythrin-like domain-containing protein
MEKAMAGRGNAKARKEILEMLMGDHKRVKRAFRDGEKLTGQEDDDGLEQIVRQTCAELTVHATLEEELFYPALRKEIRETDLLDEAEVEHTSAKTLIAELEQMDSSDPKFAATFKVLGEYVKHHIREEEGELFPLLGRTGVRWEALQQEMQRRREELMAENGLADRAEAADEEATPASGSRRGRSRRKEEMPEEETAE